MSPPATRVGPPLSPLAEAALLATVCRGLFGDDAPAPTIGRYVVHERIGRGGHGEVFAGFDPELRREVAIKTLRLDRNVDARAWLLAEGRTLARLAHEHVVAVFDVGAYTPPAGELGVFLVMELFRRGSLDQVLPALDRPAIVAALQAAGRGLAFAHAQGVVHCDFKPSNLLFADDGRVAVADFGLARALHGGPSPSGGTAGYMAPEQRRPGASVDARADQHAYCATWIEALTGMSPGGDDAWRGLLPPAEVAVLSRGLAEEPRHRFEDMPALLAALGAADRAMPRRRARTRWIAIAGLTAALAGVATASSGTPCPAPPSDALTAAEQVRAQLAAPELGTARARVDEFDAQWHDAHRATCEAIAAPWRPHAQACLDAAIVELRDRVSRLVAPVTAEAARIALAGLPAPQRCVRPDALAADAAAREELARRPALESSEHLAQAHAMAIDGRYAEAAALAEAALAASSEPSLPHVRVAALRQLGAAAHRLGELERARAALEAAYFDALALGDDDAAVAVAREAAIELVYLFGDTLAQPDDALRWARHAKVLVASDARGASWYLHGGIAAAELARGDYAAARAAAATAIRDGRGADLATSHRWACLVELRAGARVAAQRACATARAAAVAAGVTAPDTWAELDRLAAELAMLEGAPLLATAHAGIADAWRRAAAEVAP